MFRIAEEYLTHWANKPHRKPLVVRGARQVGKSTLVRHFSEKQNIDLIEVNLELIGIQEFKKESDFDIDAALREIEARTKKKITPSSLLFIDEIQEIPRAVNWLRYFYEKKPELKVIAAGSLLEAKLQKEKFQMPVGRIEFFHLGPMTFKEFCLAKGLANLWSHVEDELPINEGIHDQLCTVLKEYLFVGGMPESVRVFVESGSMGDVRDVHRSIVQTYETDIPKYSKGKESERVLKIFHFAPKNIGKKVRYSQISDEKSTALYSAIDLLSQARVIAKVNHTNASGLPLKAGEDASVFKLYFLDVGLCNYLQGLEWEHLVELPSDELLTRGEMAEQFAAQHLLYRSRGLEDPNLFYWLRDKKSQNAEVDFVISTKGQIFPLEVKAGTGGKMRSLWQFLYEKKLSKAVRFDTGFRSEYVQTFSYKIRPPNGKIAKVEGSLINLPLYMVDLVEQRLARL